MPVSLVTPSTRPATSSPNASRTSSSEALVSSTVSCSSAAHSVSVSRRMPGADLRHADRVDDEVLARLAALVGVVLAGEHERLDDAVAVDRLGDLVGVLLDDREQVGEQLALERREVGRDRRRPRAVRRGRRGRPAGAPRPRPAASPSGAPPAIGGWRALVLRRGVRPLARIGVAGQVSESVLEPSMVGPEGGRALERGARGRLDEPEGRPFAIEGDEIELREDPHQAPRERRRPRLRPLAPEHGLEGLPAGLPRPRAARGRGRSAGRAGRSPTRVFVEQSVAQAHPTPDGSTPCADGRSSSARARGRTAGRRRRRARSGAASSGSSSSAAHEQIAKPPTRSRSVRARCGACATTASTGSPRGDEIGEQAGDAGAARVAALATGVGARAARAADAPGRAASSRRARRAANAGSPITSIGAGPRAGGRGGARAAARRRRSSG